MVVNVQRVAVSPLAEPKTLGTSSSPSPLSVAQYPPHPFFEDGREWLHSCPLPLPDSSR